MRKFLVFHFTQNLIVSHFTRKFIVFHFMQNLIVFYFTQNLIVFHFMQNLIAFYFTRNITGNSTARSRKLHADIPSIRKLQG